MGPSCAALTPAAFTGVTNSSGSSPVAGSLTQSCSNDKLLQALPTRAGRGARRQLTSSKTYNHQDSLAKVPKPAVKSNQPCPIHCCTVSSFCSPQFTFPSHSSTFCIYFLHIPRAFCVRLITILIKDLKRSSYANEVMKLQFGEIAKTYSFYLH